VTRMRRKRTHSERQHGFTLVEVLAALAIAAVIIAATGALVHNVALHFEWGTRGVSEGERLILAVERLAADIGSARFVSRTSADSSGQSGKAIAFIGEPATGEQPAKMIFVGPGGMAANESGEEIVSLTVEQEDDVTRLVRRRAPWRGPRTRFEDVTLNDPVVLLEGKFLISFAFGRVTPGNALAWSDDWKGQVSLPRFVRLKLRDRVTGANLLAGTEFVIRADASAGCAQSGSGTCVSSAASKPRRTHDE
jgi:prepilin-type N-terminal cleavage/methylation domain-containing protein